MNLTRKFLPWVLWLGITVVIGGYLYQELNDEEQSSTVFLPGPTTHGHYQIEMECAVCHDNEAVDGTFTSLGVTNHSCNACHKEDLDDASDSHPTRKFKNPENFIFLKHVDAMQCTSCHSEHRLERTSAMGVTIPADYCAHCHEVTLENLESHKNLAYDTCATAGCHNYHDNVALAPSFMIKHYGEDDHFKGAKVRSVNQLQRWLSEGNKPRAPLTREQADAPEKYITTESLDHWLNSAHARSGINCSDCHNDQVTQQWVESPTHQSCSQCHEPEVTSFLKGKHGMRLAHKGLSSMTPAMARQPMKDSAAHATLSCSSCHDSHNYDRNVAAYESCIKCHNDDHTRNYEKSHHYRLWQDELSGKGEAGTGVSCATCHMPREEHDEMTVVNHNQNANLTPNEKMLQSVCMQCHGMEFGMSSLADRPLITGNFVGQPASRHPGINWTANAAIARGEEEIIAIRKYLESVKRDSPPEQEDSAPSPSHPPKEKEDYED